jgi:L-2-hydroxyglutarate oxidase
VELDLRRPVDVAIVGAGIVGLATAYRLLEARPALRLVVLEKEHEVGAHQTGHNSGVVHAGLYYPPGSLKARLCLEGKADLEAFAERHGIAIAHPGKLVVATHAAELPALEAIHSRAIANGIPGLELVGPERIREIEPHVTGLRALWSPSTGVIDYGQVARVLADEVRARGGLVLTGAEVTAIGSRDRAPAAVPGRAGAAQALIRLSTRRGELQARNLVSCAGLHADRVARLTGDESPERIVPFRGDYYTLAPDARHLVRGLVYPVPAPDFPFLGVHLTRRIDGEVWAGPNAVLALAREGYRRSEVSVRDLVATLADPGFRGLARRYWRTGLAEQWRDLSRRAFHAELHRFVPALRIEDLAPGPSGVRAQALDPAGRLVDDFRISGDGHVLHVRNAPSPAATASLAIGREIAGMAIERFGLA